MASFEECSLVLPSMEGARAEIDIAALVETYSPLLFRVAHSVLRSRAEAEDLVQDVFVRTLKHRHSLFRIQDIGVWLVRVAWNLALDRRRRVRPEQLDEIFATNLAASSRATLKAAFLHGKVTRTAADWTTPVRERPLRGEKRPSSFKSARPLPKLKPPINTLLRDAKD